MTSTEETTIVQKTRDLCETILKEPGFQAMRSKVDAFMADDFARQQYQELMEKGDELHQKQHAGEEVGEAEIAAFETKRDAFLNNAVARGFLDAQQHMKQVQESVNQYLTKTFELGRVPGKDDFSGSCGTGCGCH